MATGVARLRRANRLRERKDFLRVGRVGKRQRSAHFVVLVARRFAQARDGDLTDRRLGVTVSKKVGNAVNRNRVKRRIRSFFRHSCGLLPEARDIVVIARKGAAALPAGAVDAELTALFGQVTP